MDICGYKPGVIFIPAFGHLPVEGSSISCLYSQVVYCK